MPRLPKLRSDLIAMPSQVDGVTVHTLKDPVTGRYFRLREPEYWITRQLDGAHSFEQIASEFKSTFGFDLGVGDIEQFVASLTALFFIEDGRSEQELNRAVREAASRRSLASRLLYIKLKGFGPGRALDLLTKLYRPFHKRIWFVAQIILIAIGLGLLAGNSEQFAVRLGDLFHLMSIITIIISLSLLVSLHEFAHAVLCRYYGGQVREMGFLLMYLQPCFYCDISDVWLFPKRTQRMAVTWAGLHFQLVFLAACIIIWRITISGYPLNELARTCVIVSGLTFLFNLNPLIKLDGYYLLSDWLDIPNLRSKAISYLGNVFQRRVLGWPIESVSVTRRERKIFPVYAVLGIAYSTFLIVIVVKWLAVFLAASLGGPGILLLCLGLLIILRQNIVMLARGIIQHIGYMKQLLAHPIKLITYIVIIAIVLCAGLFIPVPNHVSGKVTTQPIAEFSITLGADGILGMSTRIGGESPEQRSNVIKVVSSDVGAVGLSPIVREGQQVKVGDTLAVVTSNQVSRDIASGIAELHRLEGDLALLKAPKKREEIAEAQAKVNGAKAHYDQLARDLTRAEELASKNLIPADRLETARSSAAVAKAEMNDKLSALALLKSPPRPEEIAVIEHDITRQRARLDYLTSQAQAQVVTAPVAGTVTFSLRPEAMLSIIDISTLELQVPVTDFDIKLIASGQTSRLKVRSFAGTSFVGKVVRVPKFAIEIDGQMRFPVAVAVDNSSSQLKQGMSGYAKIEVGETSSFGYLFRKLASMIYVEVWSWF
jgi:putative peptide zinc metalloprotease protein